MSDGNLWLQLLWTFFVLAVILVMAYLFTRFFGQRLAGGRSGRAMKVIDSLSLGPRRQLILVKVRDRILMIGVAEGGLNLIERFEDDGGFDDVELPGGFNRRLEEEIQRLRGMRVGDADES